MHGNQESNPPLMTTEDYYALRWAVYVSYLPWRESEITVQRRVA